MSNYAIPQGFLLINKPSGVTSRYCVDTIVRIIKESYQQKIKVGHAGTLDTFANGLLIIGIDRAATREISALMKLDKIYAATGKLGQLTDTLDLTGVVIQEKDTAAVMQHQLQSVINNFPRVYHQIPPLYSALKYQGRQLSKLARAQKFTEEQFGTIVKHKAREVTLFSLELLDFSNPFFTIKAHVSHGTYIRALVNDIAQKLGLPATTHELMRERIGPFLIDDAVPLQAVKSIDDIHASLILVDAMLAILTQYSQGANGG